MQADMNWLINKKATIVAAFLLLSMVHLSFLQLRQTQRNTLVNYQVGIYGGVA